MLQKYEKKYIFFTELFTVDVTKLTNVIKCIRNLKYRVFPDSTETLETCSWDQNKQKMTFNHRA